MNRLINIALALAFTLCYTEWGTSQSAFIFDIEYQLFFKKADVQDALSHPLILAGLAGQLCLLYAVIFNGRPVWINIAGVLLLGMVVLLFLLIGILSGNAKIIASTLPFIALTLLFFYHQWKRSNKAG